MTYRIAGAMECEDLPALVLEFPQPFDSVRPSRNPDWIDGTRVLKIGNGESNRRPRRVSVNRKIVPELRSYKTMDELDMITIQLNEGGVDVPVWGEAAHRSSGTGE